MLRMKSEKQSDFFVRNDFKTSEEQLQNGLLTTNNSISASISLTAKDTSQTFLYGEFNGGDSAGEF